MGLKFCYSPAFNSVTEEKQSGIYFGKLNNDTYQMSVISK